MRLTFCGANFSTDSTLLGVAWGISEQVGGKKGTFHEFWRVQWRPELTLSLIAASIFGNTILDAASNCADQQAGCATALAEIAGLVEKVLLADLPRAIPPVIAKLQEMAATHSDVAELADALSPLTAIVRYGTVRRTEADQVLPVLDAIFTRLCVGIPGACVSLDDDSAATMSKRMDAVNAVVGLFDDAGKKSLWMDALAEVAALQGGHALVSGKAERLRFDLGVVGGDHLALRLGQAASSGAGARVMAAFVEGLLDGPGAILLHHDSLFRAVDDWLVNIDVAVFEEVLPLVRRSFALFARPERRQIGERVAGRVPAGLPQGGLNEERAARILPTIRLILGLGNE